MSARYIHGTQPDEQERLSKLNNLLNEAELNEMSLSAGMRILDVGSGLGQFTRTMARSASPDAHVVGIEIDEVQLAGAKRLASEAGEDELVSFRQGNALELPLTEIEKGAFDLAHARFVLEHVTEPLAVVRQMVKAVRAGGSIVLADDDHSILRLNPDVPRVAALWNAYYKTYERMGNDPYIGRRLTTLLHLAGAQPVRSTWLFFGACAGQESFAGITSNFIGILEGARETIVSEALFDSNAFDDVIEEFRAWTERPDAAFWYAVAWAEGVRV